MSARVEGRAAELGDRGSASLWVVAGGVLVLLVAFVAVARGSAVLARERAEAAADLAALAVADGIGVDGSIALMCRRAAGIARQNDASVRACSVRLGADGRTGTVDVTVTVAVRLAGVGNVRVSASARAGRLAWGAATQDGGDAGQRNAGRGHPSAGDLRSSSGAANRRGQSPVARLGRPATSRCRGATDCGATARPARWINGEPVPVDRRRGRSPPGFRARRGRRLLGPDAAQVLARGDGRRAS